MRLPVRLALAGAFALMIAIVGWSVGSPPADATERRSAIEGRTETRRDLLRRRYEQFRRLPDSEQAEIRRLHEAVEADSSLARTLDEYESFVATLDPWDQQELRQITDSDERLARVKAFAYERGRRDAPWRPSWISGRFVEGTIFQPQEFEQALEIVSDSLNLSATQHEEIDALDEPHVRHLRLLQLAADRFRKGSPRWPQSETTAEILALLPEGRRKTWILDERHPAEFRRAAVPLYLTRSLLAEWQLILPDAVNREQLRSALDSIPERDQAEWARHDPNRLQRALIEELEKQEGPTGDFARDFGQVVKLHAEFDPFSYRRFGRPPGGSGRGGPGGPRRPDGDPRSAEDRNGPPQFESDRSDRNRDRERRGE